MVQNAFNQCQKIEDDGMKDLIPFLKKYCAEGRFVEISDGPNAREIQKYFGDFAVNASNGNFLMIEAKTELENKHDNFWLESFSNKKEFTMGWMFTLKADILIYFFQSTQELYVIHMRNLKKWAFGNGGPWNILKYPEKPQSKYEQKNDTYGWCVPIKILLSLGIAKRWEI